VAWWDGWATKATATHFHKLQLACGASARPLVSGTLPRALGMMQGLSAVKIVGCSRLSGTIPSELGELRGLLKFELSGTAVSGTLPTRLGSVCEPSCAARINDPGERTRCHELVHNPRRSACDFGSDGFAVHGNRISGTLPSSTSWAVGRTRLLVAESAISGTLPTALGFASHDVTLRLPRLSGTLPEAVRCNAGLWKLRLATGAESGTSWIAGHSGTLEIARTSAPTTDSSSRSCGAERRPTPPPISEYPASCCVHNCWLRGACVAGACVCESPWGGIDCGVRVDQHESACRGGRRTGVWVDESAFRHVAASTPLPSADYDGAAREWGAARRNGGRYDCALSPQTSIRPSYKALDLMSRYDVFDLLLLRLLAAPPALRAPGAACAAFAWNPIFGTRIAGNVDENTYAKLLSRAGNLRAAALPVPHIHETPLDRGGCEMANMTPAVLRAGDVVLTHWGNEDCFVDGVHYIVVPASNSRSLRVPTSTVGAYVDGRWQAQRKPKGCLHAQGCVQNRTRRSSLARGWRVSDDELAAIARRTYSEHQIGRPRRQVLYFRGSVREQRAEEMRGCYEPRAPTRACRQIYSMGIRQTVKRLIGAHPFVEFNQPGARRAPNGTADDGGIRSPNAKYGDVEFCLDAPGHGWPVRVVDYLAWGCIPVIVRERVRLSYEPWLDYRPFAIVVRHEDIPRLPSLLRNLTADARQQMRRRMAEAHRFFLWDSAYGKGFEFVMRILQDLGQPKRAAKLPGKDQQHVRVHL
jgi:hypothetical protein